MKDYSGVNKRLDALLLAQTHLNIASASLYQKSMIADRHSHEKRALYTEYERLQKCLDTIQEMIKEMVP